MQAYRVLPGQKSADSERIEVASAALGPRDQGAQVNRGRGNCLYP